MFRNTARRSTASESVSLHQDQALNTTIFLLKSFGPTGFLLREDGEVGDVRVSLGDPHACTCPAFTKEQEPCKHICWVLLRKFRLPREHEYSFQRGLVDRQILELLHGLHQTKGQQAEDGTLSQAASGPQAGRVCRRPIQAQDVCPICHEALLLEKGQPVSHCRFGCGNNIHISCMQVWAEYQGLSGGADAVKCPLCREDFCSLQLLREQARNAAKLFTGSEREKPNRHLGVRCQGCRLGPVTGKCFKCTVCSYFYLCEDCVKKGSHPQHPLTRRMKRRVQRPSQLMTGELLKYTKEDIVPAAAQPLPQYVLDRLPTVRVKPGSLLSDVGQQCRICLLEFSLGQRVRTLPCHHKTHLMHNVALSPPHTSVPCRLRGRDPAQVELLPRGRIHVYLIRIIKAPEQLLVSSEFIHLVHKKRLRTLPLSQVNTSGNTFRSMRVHSARPALDSGSGFGLAQRSPAVCCVQEQREKAAFV
uniref:Zinc finger, SWIM-type containing 2 n=1 Tax=Gasterosteus aculeatus aculeatus TaxID=481459 RepID=A0AAQ4RV08_GASAC